MSSALASTPPAPPQVMGPAPDRAGLRVAVNATSPAMAGDARAGHARRPEDAALQDRAERHARGPFERQAEYLEAVEPAPNLIVERHDAFVDKRGQDSTGHCLGYRADLEAAIHRAAAAELDCVPAVVGSYRCDNCRGWQRGSERVDQSLDGGRSPVHAVILGAGARSGGRAQRRSSSAAPWPAPSRAAGGQRRARRRAVDPRQGLAPVVLGDLLEELAVREVALEQPQRTRGQRESLG
jgi:hypothetical protein